MVVALAGCGEGEGGAAGPVTDGRTGMPVVILSDDEMSAVEFGSGDTFDKILTREQDIEALIKAEQQNETPNLLAEDIIATLENKAAPLLIAPDSGAQDVHQVDPDSSVADKILSAWEAHIANPTELVDVAENEATDESEADDAPNVLWLYVGGAGALGGLALIPNQSDAPADLPNAQLVGAIYQGTAIAKARILLNNDANWALSSGDTQFATSDSDGFFTSTIAEADRGKIFIASLVGATNTADGSTITTNIIYRGFSVDSLFAAQTTNVAIAISPHTEIVIQRIAARLPQSEQVEGSQFRLVAEEEARAYAVDILGLDAIDGATALTMLATQGYTASGHMQDLDARYKARILTTAPIIAEQLEKQTREDISLADLLENIQTELPAPAASAATDFL